VAHELFEQYALPVIGSVGTLLAGFAVSLLRNIVNKISELSTTVAVIAERYAHHTARIERIETKLDL
jgi:hypothetical protein